MDGMTFLELNNVVTKAITTFNPLDAANLPEQSSSTIDIPNGYIFATTPTIEEHIARIRAQLKEDTSRFEFRAFEIPTLNRELFRVYKCPTNSGVQLALQLAVRRWFGYNPAAFEPVSLNNFHNGRIDMNYIMRPAIANFCAAAAEVKAPTSELRALLFDAAHTHASSVNSVARGHGFDRHLLALEWCIREDETIPALFGDPTFKGKRRPKQVMTNCITSGALECGDIPSHPEGLSIVFDTKEES